MAKQRAPEMGGQVVCPYCGKKGIVMRIFSDGNMDVCHKVERRMIRTQSGGQIEAECFLDGCSRDGKTGSEHWAKASLEEEF